METDTEPLVSSSVSSRRPSYEGWKLSKSVQTTLPVVARRPSYEGWKPITGATQKFGCLPGDLPMRDGNYMGKLEAREADRPGDLPMRDGNPFNTALGVGVSLPGDLPMRDGNTMENPAKQSHHRGVQVPPARSARVAKQFSPAKSAIPSLLLLRFLLLLVVASIASDGWSSPEGVAEYPTSAEPRPAS